MAQKYTVGYVTVEADVKVPLLPSPFQGPPVAEEHLTTPAPLPCNCALRDRSRWARPTVKMPPIDVR
jgi:hypothetical protein